MYLMHAQIHLVNIGDNGRANKNMKKSVNAKIVVSIIIILEIRVYCSITMAFVG